LPLFLFLKLLFINKLNAHLSIYFEMSRLDFTGSLLLLFLTLTIVILVSI